MGRHVFGSRNFPGASPGKLLPVGAPNPLSDRPCHIVSGFIDRAILAAPILLDFCITCATVNIDSGSASWIFLLPNSYTPCSVLIIVPVSYTHLTLPTNREV